MYALFSYIIVNYRFPCNCVTLPNWTCPHKSFYQLLIFQHMLCSLISLIYVYINDLTNVSVCHFIFYFYNSVFFLIFYFLSFVPNTFSVGPFSDVGMIMMQTGMVKQGLNSARHAYLHGMITLTILQIHLHIYIHIYIYCI